MINAYNALSMGNVVGAGIPQTHAGLAKVRFFVLRKLVIGGTPMSLYAFENDVIRPFTRSIGEPRVHFALNCSAVSCPVLPRTPFRTATLDAELERETRAFFARPENFRVEPAARCVWLSEILKFYPEDFVPAFGSNLIDFANRYVPVPAPIDWEVSYTPYDWTVANSRRARAGAATRRNRRRPAARWSSRLRSPFDLRAGARSRHRRFARPSCPSAGCGSRRASRARSAPCRRCRRRRCRWSRPSAET